MYGAMIGDIIGSVYESTGINTKRFLLFPMNTSVTDDSIMTVAVARSLISWNRKKESLHDAMIRSMRKYGWKYPNPPGKYDSKFQKWLSDDVFHCYEMVVYNKDKALRCSCSYLFAGSPANDYHPKDLTWLVSDGKVTIDSTQATWKENFFDIIKIQRRRNLYE